MQIPGKIPALRLALVLTAVYAAAWISLEGSLWRVVLMGASVTAVSLGFLIQKYAGGRYFTLVRWLLLTAGVGLLLGLGSGVFTLLFMGIKTGLHAHGPEFTLTEIRWLIDQIPLWSLAGLSGGLGVGMLTGKTSRR